MSSRPPSTAHQPGRGRSRPRRFPRPDRYIGPVFSTLFLLAAFGAVAHASGSGWVQAVGSITGGLAAVGLIGPALAASHLRLDCVTAPRDATRGEPYVIEVVSSRPLRCTPASPPGRPVVVPAGSPTPVSLIPPHRGTLTTVRVRLATASPLGLLWWSVERRLELPVSVAVFPGLGDGVVGGVDGLGDETGRGRPLPAPTGEIRGVRNYQHGDSRRRVHWRATAHTGALMVRENEVMPDTPVRIVADLSDDPDRGDEQASDVLATVTRHLALGRRVLLETVEQGQRGSAVVLDRLSAGRRLARAGSNPYAEAERARSPRRRRHRPRAGDQPSGAAS